MEKRKIHLKPSGPDRELTAELNDYGLTFISIGPRGGWTCQSIPVESLQALRELLTNGVQPDAAAVV